MPSRERIPSGLQGELCKAVKDTTKKRFLYSYIINIVINIIMLLPSVKSPDSPSGCYFTSAFHTVVFRRQSLACTQLPGSDVIPPESDGGTQVDRAEQIRVTEAPDRSCIPSPY